MPALTIPVETWARTAIAFAELQSASAINTKFFRDNLSYRAAIESAARSSHGSVYSTSQGRFEVLNNQIVNLESLRDNWDSFGSEPPNALSLSIARSLLQLFVDRNLAPRAVVASGEGGTAIVFTGRAGLYAHVEVYNDGEVSVLTYRDNEAARIAVIPESVTKFEDAFLSLLDLTRGEVGASAAYTRTPS